MYSSQRLYRSAINNNIMKTQEKFTIYNKHTQLGFGIFWRNFALLPKIKSTYCSFLHFTAYLCCLNWRAPALNLL